MSDPLGLIGSTRPIAPPVPGQVRPGPADANGIGFKSLLEEQLAQVNELQRDAKEGVEDIMAGRRDDLEGVILATQKADTAFRMLLQIRNKMMDAYEEVKQIRV